MVLGFAVYSVWDRRKQKKPDEGDSLGSSASQKQLWGGGKERKGMGREGGRGRGRLLLAGEIVTIMHVYDQRL